MNRGKLGAISMFILLTSIIIVSTSIYYNNSIRVISNQMIQELTSIANLKINQISDWYIDEIHDAEIIAQDPDLKNLIQSWLNNPTQEESLKIERILRQISQEHDIEVVSLIDPHGAFSISSLVVDESMDSVLINTAKEVCIQQKTISTDLYRHSENNKIYIDFISPINLQNQVTVALAFQISPEKHLFPLANSWPNKSKTAETILLRREGNHALVLNQLQMGKIPAMTKTFSLLEDNILSVQAVNGTTGAIEGYDYKNQLVYGYLGQVHNTNWYIACKIDRSELFEKLSSKSWSIFLFAFMLIFTGGAILALNYNLKEKNTYKKLLQSQKLFKTTLYSIGDAVITTNNQGNIIQMNPVAEALTGFIEAESIGKPLVDVFQIYNEDDGKSVESPVLKVIRNGSVVGLSNHTILRTKQGFEIPITDSGAPVLDENGKIEGVVLVFRDQTIERQQQRDIEESRRRLLTLMSNLKGMVYRCLNDMDFTMNFVSQGAYELTGYSPEELQNNQSITFAQLIVDEDIDKVRDEIQKALATQNHFHLEYRITTKTGEVKWIWEQGQGVFNEQRELIALEGFIADITERKKTELALKTSEALFQTLTNNVSVGIFRTDIHGLTTYVNPKWSELSGLTYDEAMGNGWLERVHPIDKEQLLNRWQNDNQSSKTSEAEYRFLHPDGKIVWVKGLAVAELDTKGNVIGFIGSITEITESKNAEILLKNSEEQYKYLFNNNPLPMWIYDLNTLRFLMANDSATNHYGYSNDEFVSMTIQDIFPKEDIPVLLEYISQPSESLNKSKIWKHIKKDGQTIDVEIVSHSFNYEGHQARLVLANDISERIKAEEALKNSEEQYRNLFENHSAIKLMIDPDSGQIVNANKAATKYYGWSLGQLKKMNIFDINTLDIKDIKNIMNFAKQNTHNTFEVVHRLADGQIRDVEIFTSSIQFQGKEYLHSIIHDITDRKKAEQKIKLLSQSVEQTPVSIVITDSKGVIEYINPELTRITGYTLSEVIGKTTNIFSSGYHKPEFYKKIWDSILSGEIWQGEFYNKRKNGELFWEKAIIAPIANNDDVITHFVALKEDVTEKKQLIEDLIREKSKAEESEKLKTAFLANMSHEIRTPLNSILGFTDFLITDNELTSEEKEQYTTIINKNAEGLLQIINDIIDISSLETGQMKINYKPVKINGLLENINAQMLLKIHDLDKNEVEMNCQLQDDIDFYTDENRLYQIINNLVTNAIKFTDKGQINFGIERISSEGIYFIVSDTGIGISPDKQKLIFERFRQVESSETRSYSGNGLGLAIVKNLIELMNGKISLISEKGIGSTFRFFLPQISLVEKTANPQNKTM